MFDAYEAVDQLIDDINDGEYDNCLPKTGKEIYESIHRVLCKDVESGAITLEFADEINEMAYDKYVLESVTGGTIAAVGVALAATAGALAKIVNSIRTKKGYEKDAELNNLRQEAIKLKNELESTQRSADRIYTELQKSVDEYNKLAKQYNAATIKLSSDASDVKTIRDDIRVAVNNADDAIDINHASDRENRSTAMREEINPNYNPEKALGFKRKARAMQIQADKYYAIYCQMNINARNLHKIRKKLDKYARSSASPQERAAIKESLREVDNELKSSVRNLSYI